MHHIAIQRDQTAGITAGALDLNARIQIFRHDGAAQQAFNHAAIDIFIANEFARHTQATGHGKHPALGAGQRARTNGRNRQERRPAIAVLAQVIDHALGVLIPIHHHILQRAAQGHIHGALQLFRHANQIRHHAMHARTRRSARLQQHLLDGILIALIIALHFLEQLEPRTRLLPAAHQNLHFTR